MSVLDIMRRRLKSVQAARDNAVRLRARHRAQSLTAVMQELTYLIDVAEGMVPDAA